MGVSVAAYKSLVIQQYFIKSTIVDSGIATSLHRLSHRVASDDCKQPRLVVVSVRSAARLVQWLLATDAIGKVRGGRHLSYD